MTDEAAVGPTYLNREAAYAGERSWRLTSQTLAWSSAQGAGEIAFAGVRHVRLWSTSRVAGLQGTGAPGLEVCVIDGVKLVSTHFLDPGYEDRRASFRPFIAELVRRIGQWSPQARFSRGASPALVGLMSLAAFAALGLAVWAATTALDLLGLGDQRTNGYLLAATALALLIGAAGFAAAALRARPRSMSAEAAARAFG